MTQLRPTKCLLEVHGMAERAHVTAEEIVEQETTAALAMLRQIGRAHV